MILGLFSMSHSTINTILNLININEPTTFAQSLKHWISKNRNKLYVILMQINLDMLFYVPNYFQWIYVAPISRKFDVICCKYIFFPCSLKNHLYFSKIFVIGYLIQLGPFMTYLDTHTNTCHYYIMYGCYVSMFQKLGTLSQIWTY